MHPQNLNDRSTLQRKQGSSREDLLTVFWSPKTVRVQEGRMFDGKQVRLGITLLMDGCDDIFRPCPLAEVESIGIQAKSMVHFGTCGDSWKFPTAADCRCARWHLSPLVPGVSMIEV